MFNHSYIRHFLSVFVSLRDFELITQNSSENIASRQSRCIYVSGIYEGKYAISRKNLANESLRNCDVRQVLCILTIFCRFKPKNVCILPKVSSFQSFQSKKITVKC